MREVEDARRELRLAEGTISALTVRPPLRRLVRDALPACAGGSGGRRGACVVRVKRAFCVCCLGLRHPCVCFVPTSPASPRSSPQHATVHSLSPPLQDEVSLLKGLVLHRLPSTPDPRPPALRREDAALRAAR